jgi:hypothetical protein
MHRIIHHQFKSYFPYFTRKNTCQILSVTKITVFLDKTQFNLIDIYLFTNCPDIFKVDVVGDTKAVERVT